MGLKIKVELCRVSDVAVNDGTRPAIAAAVRVALALGEEPENQVLSKAMEQELCSYRTWWRCEEQVGESE